MNNVIINKTNVIFKPISTTTTGPAIYINPDQFIVKFEWAKKRYSYCTKTKEKLSRMLEIRKLVNSFFAKKIRKIEWHERMRIFRGYDDEKFNTTYIDSTFRMEPQKINTHVFFVNMHNSTFECLILLYKTPISTQIDSMENNQLEIIQRLIKSDKVFSRYARKYSKIISQQPEKILGYVVQEISF
ncbi:hypothetical protein phiOC_p156 [Ochrobactrum phage vB_OspM_OC]|nr:hypothetical protein phiOC_p156 [Ochrobactrum phage vB_OspM_OC]